ncbi:hypothetical protein GWI33_014487, partial [Rhynchophorus ferrugineus]
QELVQLRTGNPITPTHQAKNDRLTVKWLSNAVREVKTEISELQNVLNGSQLLVDKEQTETSMNLFRSDLANLNEELETMRTKNARYEAEIGLMRAEFETLKRDSRSAAVANGKLKNQLRTLQAEWKTLQDKQLSPLPADNETHSRHHRILRQHVVHLERNTKLLHKENIFLKNRLVELESEIGTMKKTRRDSDSFDRINGNDLQNYIETNKIQPIGISGQTNNDNTKRQVIDLTKQQSINTETIANLSQQIVNFDKLHLSMLELLENIESLENKVDKAFPEIRVEISKMEAQSNQITADVSYLKEDRNNARESMKAISFSVSKLQEDGVDGKNKLKQIEERLKSLEKSNVIQHSRLHDHILKDESSTVNLNATKSTIHLVEELKSFESEYKSIVNKLPRGCDSVDGPKGIYLISPGDGEPILAHCDRGWTTIQKRYDGSINFNRNWNEYSNGFGSATGEHWLGNRNMHHLTKDNCTMLQINLKDIYGEYWQATYDHFHVADFRDGFRLTVSHYHGNASDAMNYQNRMEFSTVDNDRDISNTHCASNYEGGWWFSHCQQASLNGRYNLGLTWFDSSRNEWIAVAQSEMKLKRRDVC